MSTMHRRQPLTKQQQGKRFSIETLIICILIVVLFFTLVGPVKRHADESHPLVLPTRGKTLLNAEIGAKMLDVEECVHAGQQLVGGVRIVPAYDNSGCSVVPADMPTCTPRV